MVVRRLPEVCPCCGGPMGRAWLGIRLTRRQAEIVSIIDRFGKAGSAVTCAYLAEIFYPDKPAAVADQVIRVIVIRSTIVWPGQTIE
jgi:hypothetical protein